MALNKPLEKDIKKSIVQFLEYSGALVWVNVSTGIYDSKRGVFRTLVGYGMRRGTSDLMGIYKKTFFAIEVKRPGGRATVEQVSFINDVTRYGGVAFVATSIDDVHVNLINKLRNT